MRTTARRVHALLSLAPCLVLAIACDGGGSDGSGDDPMAEGSADDGGTASGSEGADDATMQALCEEEDRDDEFSLGLAHAGASMQFAIADADPAMPIRGDNAWTIAITDEAGAPMDGLILAARPQMPDHGHGTPVQAVVTPLEDGHYAIAPLNLFMAGYWEVTISSEDPEDSVIFKVCVD